MQISKFAYSQQLTIEISENERKFEIGKVYCSEEPKRQWNNKDEIDSTQH